MMKNLQQTLMRWAGAFGMMCLLATLISSCTKDRYYYGDNGNGQSNTPAAALTVIDASTNSGSLDFYLDKNRANNSAITYGNGLDYLNAYTGTRTAAFYTYGTNTLIKSDTITLKANNYYSLYLANLVTKPDYLFLRDTLTQPANGTAMVRFVDVSTDAPAVDFGITGRTAITTNKSYKGYSSFVAVKGDSTYTYEVRAKGTSTVLVSQSNIVLRKGSIYTFWLHGLAAATDNTRLTLDIQRNAYY